MRTPLFWTMDHSKYPDNRGVLGCLDIKGVLSEGLYNSIEVNSQSTNIHLQLHLRS